MSDNAATPPASILVVDDTPDNRDILTRRLHEQGHRVTLAGNGAECLDRMRAEPFDLVLLDVMMPVMSGYDVLEAIRADPALRGATPVVVVSSLSDIDSVVRCIELGAEDYVFKPFKLVLLRARIGALLEKKRLRDREREAMRRLAEEQGRTEKLLLNVLPKPVVERLKTSPGTIADNFDDVSILFADINDFSGVSAGLAPTEVVELLNRVFSAFDKLVERRGLEKIKTIGDAYMAAGGLPTPRPDHAEAVAELALEMQCEASRIRTPTGEPISLRVGINTGPVVAGVIGKAKFAYDLWGRTVNAASKMESLGLPGVIQVTKATYEHLKDHYFFEARGEFYVSGEGAIETFLLKGRKHGPRPK